MTPRDPDQGDLLKICKSLNDHGAKYLVIGGMAMVLHGFNRGTEDIDLLVDKVASNISLLKKALSILPDNAIQDVRDSDVEKYEKPKKQSARAESIPMVSCVSSPWQALAQDFPCRPSRLGGRIFDQGRPAARLW